MRPTPDQPLPRRTRHWRGAVGVFAVALIVGGCTGDGADDSPTATGEAAATATGDPGDASPTTGSQRPFGDAVLHLETVELGTPLAEGAWIVEYLSTIYEFEVPAGGEWRVRVREIGHIQLVAADTGELGARDVVTVQPEQVALDGATLAPMPEDVFPIGGWMLEPPPGVETTEIVDTELGGLPALMVDATVTEDADCTGTDTCIPFVERGGVEVGLEAGHRYRIYLVAQPDDIPIVVMLGEDLSDPWLDQGQAFLDDLRFQPPDSGFESDLPS